jgi:hypothetical protein
MVEPTQELLGKPKRRSHVTGKERTSLKKDVNKGGTAETRPFRPLMDERSFLYG